MSIFFAEQYLYEPECFVINVILMYSEIYKFARKIRKFYNNKKNLINNNFNIRFRLLNNNLTN